MPRASTCHYFSIFFLLTLFLAASHASADCLPVVETVKRIVGDIQAPERLQKYMRWPLGSESPEQLSLLSKQVDLVNGTIEKAHEMLRDYRRCTRSIGGLDRRDILSDSGTCAVLVTVPLPYGSICNVIYWYMSNVLRLELQGIGHPLRLDVLKNAAPVQLSGGYDHGAESALTPRAIVVVKNRIAGWCSIRKGDLYSGNMTGSIVINAELLQKMSANPMLWTNGTRRAALKVGEWTYDVPANNLLQLYGWIYSQKKTIVSRDNTGSQLFDAGDSRVYVVVDAQGRLPAIDEEVQYEAVSLRRYLHGKSIEAQGDVYEYFDFLALALLRLMEP